MHIGPQHHQHADEAGEHDRVPECEAQDRAFTISPYLAYRKEPDHDVKDQAPDRHLRRHCENEDRHQIGQNQCNDSGSMSPRVLAMKTRSVTTVTAAATVDNALLSNGL